MVPSFEVNRMKPIFVSSVTPRGGPEKYTLNLFSHWPRSMLADQSSINFTNGRNFGRRPGKKRFLGGKQIFEFKRFNLHTVTQVTRYRQNGLASYAKQDGVALVVG